MAEVVRTGRDVRSKWRLREIQAGGAQISDVLLQRAEIMKRWFATPLIGTPSVIKIVPEIPRNSAGKILVDRPRQRCPPEGIGL
jgi:hypothetical protein